MSNTKMSFVAMLRSQEQFARKQGWGDLAASLTTAIINIEGMSDRAWETYHILSVDMFSKPAVQDEAMTSPYFQQIMRTKHYLHDTSKGPLIDPNTEEGFKIARALINKTTV